MAYPVRYRAGGDLVPEGLRPPADADVRGDYRRALLVARADQLEQQVGAPFVDVQVAELVYDEELGVRVVLEPLLQDAPRPGVPQVVDEPRAVDELDLAASTPMATARWVFPTPGLPTGRTFSARSMNPRVESSSRSGRGTDGWNVQSESASVFTHGRPEERILSLVILSVLAPASTWVISATAACPPP